MLRSGSSDFIKNFFPMPLPACVCSKSIIETRQRKRCEICSKLTKTLERPQWRLSGVFIFNLERIYHLFQCYNC